MVTHPINAILFKHGDTFEGFTIGELFRTGEIQGFTVTHSKGTASLYCKRKSKATEKEISAFKERAQRLQSISDPLVPAVLGFGYSASARCFWLATEEEHGASLASCFEASRKLITPLQALVVFTNVAGLLQKVEDVGFHHYALTPDLIYLASKAEVCCVADIGLIEVFDAQPPRATFENIAYRAPEMLRGERSAAADIFSIGMILWELMARRAPYTSKRSGPYTLDEEHIYALENLELPSLTALKVPVPDYVSAFVQCVTAKGKEARLLTWERVIYEVVRIAKAWGPILTAESMVASSSEAAAANEGEAAPSSAAPSSGAAAAPPSEAELAPSSGAAAAPPSEAAAAPSSAAPPRGPVGVALFAAAVALASLAFMLGARQAPASSGAASSPPPVNVSVSIPPVALSVSALCSPEPPPSPALAPVRPSPRPKTTRPAEVPSHAKEQPAVSNADREAIGGGPKREPEPASRATLKRDYPLP